MGEEFAVVKIHSNVYIYTAAWMFGSTEIKLRVCSEQCCFEVSEMGLEMKI